MSLLVKKKEKIRYLPESYCQLNRQHIKDYRLAAIIIFFIIFGLLLGFRLFKLQILENKYYLALAAGQHEMFKQLYPTRGTIYVQDPAGPLVKDNFNYYPAATNQIAYLLSAIPSQIRDADAVLAALKEVFKIIEEPAPKDNEAIASAPPSETAATTTESAKNLVASWREKLNKKDDPYEPLRHFVTEEQINQIKSYNLEGLDWRKEWQRFYPEKNIGSQLLGYVGKQPENNILKGYYGLEGCYNKELAGETGFLRTELDTLGRWIALAGKDFRQAENGKNLILTIDRAIQYFACSALNKKVAELSAAAGSLIVMQPQTGAIIAICNAPDFDPNKYNEIEDLSVFINKAISNAYEPGSVMKPITMAAALDSGKVDPFSTYYDSGRLEISGHTIENSDLKSHGVQTMTQVLEKSLNTGAVYAARQVGRENFQRYLTNFGFGQKTNIDLCQEDNGNLKSLNEKGEIYLATASFGQGITVTPLQLLRAFGAIANEGKLMQPYVVEAVIDENEQRLEKKTLQMINQVISPETAKVLGSMLVSVVKNGHAKKAAVPGYLVGGKTGTAQVPDLERGGYSETTIHTFVGFAPFHQPRFVMVTKIDNPQGVRFAEGSAVPLFQTVAKFILDYYQVPPEEK